MPQVAEQQPKHSVVIASRQEDFGKRVGDQAKRFVRWRQNRQTLNPKTWIRGAKDRYTEDYQRHSTIHHTTETAHQENNPYITVNPRTAAVNPQANAELAQEAGEAKIEQVRMGNEMFGSRQRQARAFQDVRLAQGATRHVFENVLQEVVAGRLTTEQAVQEQLAQIVKDYTGRRGRGGNREVRDALTPLFGRRANTVRQMTQRFATDLLPVGQQIAAENPDVADRVAAIHDTDIILANPTWAGSTQAHQTFVERGIRWIKERPVIGPTLNETTLGALASVGSYLWLRGSRSKLAHSGMAVGIAGGITAASGGALPAAVGIGAVTGGTIAAVERHRHVKDDLATHSNEAGEYNLTREEHASKRRRMDHYMPAAATVSDMLASDAPRPTQFGQESRSLATLLDRGVTDYANQDNLTALAHRLGEIEARLVYSPRVRRGYINFSENGDTAEYKVEQRRLRLVQEFAGGRDALIAFLHEQAVAAQPAAPDPAEPAQPVDSDAPTEPIPVVPALPAAGDPDPANQPAPLTPEQLMENATNEADAMIAGWAARWERRLDRDRKAKNRRFQVYKAGTVALHGVRGAAIGALTGIGIDKLVELIGRHGGTTIEQKTRTQDVFTQSQAYNPQPVTIDGIETYIPQGTNVMPMPDGTYNLVMSGHQNRVLIEGITVQTDTSGQAHLSWDMQSSTVSSDNVNLTQPQHTVSNTTTMSHVRTSESRVSFADLVSRIKSRTWLHKSPPVSPNGDELRFHTVKQGSKLMLVPDGMGVSTNGQVSLNVPQAESAHELSYAFSKPGESGTPVVVDAQGSHGVLALDANDHTDFVHVEGVGQVREDVAAKLLLNEHALSQLPNGDIATEFYGHQDVFAEGGADNCPGLVEMIKPDGNGHAQVIATIHATGAPNPDIVTKQTHISSQSGPTYNQTVYDKPVVKISGEVVDKQVPYSVKSYTPVGTYHLPLTITPKFRGPLENLQTAQFARYAPHVTGGLDDEHVQAANGEPANHAPAVNGGEDTGNAHAHTPLRVVARENRYHRPTTEQLLLRDYVVAAVARGVTRELAKERFAALLVCIKGGEKAQEENTVTMHPQLREELKTLFTENFGEEENIDQMLDACFNALYSTGNIPEDEEIAKSYIHREMLALAQAYHAIQPSGETVYEAHTA